MYIKNSKNSKNLLEEFSGTVSGHRDGHGFVVRDDGEPDVYLPASQMAAVLHRDRVKVRVLRHDRRGRPEGQVLEILERPTKTIIGRLLRESGVWLVAPEDRRYGQDVIVSGQSLAGAHAGQVVVAELTEPPALHGQPVGRISEVLGEVDDAGMEIEIAVRKHGLPHVFSPECLKQAEALPDAVRPADREGRVDLSDVPFVTIDGEDARDFDDAVYGEPAVVSGRGKKPNGWRLLVAIADVSHYVKSGGPIDTDALERATSVYFPRRVIPMLPEKLSNGLCSLNPEVDRLSLVCDMLVTAQGEVRAYQFYPAVIRSHARLTYTEVAAVLLAPHGPEAKRLANLAPQLQHLHQLYKALLAARHQRGALDFDLEETQIVCDDDGRIERIEARQRNDAHRLIEECMLAANVCCADFLQRNKRIGLYRVHEGPLPEKVELLRGYLQALGLHFSLSDEPSPQELQHIAEATAARPDAPQIHMMLLRSMSQAVYTPDNQGHFGLAYSVYAHFTSPIRRYPDLLAHRVIKAVLAEQKYQLPKLPVFGEAQQKMSLRLEKVQAQRHGEAASGQPARRGPEHQAWEATGLHCSALERRAEEASRDVEAWLKCQFMSERLGLEYPATVSSVTSFGLFVTLEGLHIEGLVHIAELGGDYFIYDEQRQQLRGERTGVRYTMGTPLRVQVARVDLDARRIDLRPVHEGVATEPRGKGGKPGKNGKPAAADKRGAARDKKKSKGGKRA